MRSVAFISVLAVSAALAGCGAPEPTGPAAPSGKTVSLTGCPKAGPEPGCVYMQGSQDKLYDVGAAQPPVDLSRLKAISLTGHESTRTPTCAGAVAVDVTEWSELGMNCAAAKPEG